MTIVYNGDLYNYRELRAEAHIFPMMSRVGPQADGVAVTGAAGAGRAGLRGQVRDGTADGGRGQDRGVTGVGPQVAGAVHGATAGRPGGRPAAGAPRKITDEQVEVLVTRTLTERGRGQDTHWSTRTMAAETGLSQSSVSRIWWAFGLKPHVVETWKLSTDPEFIGKVRDVAGLYMSPPEHALVLAVDEKSQIQALDRTAPCLPILPTTPERRTHDYVRHGTTSLFAAYDLASGSVIAQHYRRHRHQEFLRFLKLIEAAVPRDLGPHLVLDNYATHKTPAIKDWLIKHPRFRLHFTPASSSWLNLVERWFAELTNRKLRRSAHRGVTELEADIRKWINEWNKDPKPFVWTESADDILETLAGYCRRVCG
jgi:transposase